MKTSMTHTTTTVLSAIGLGAVTAYFLDAESGRRRRALARDKMIHWQSDASAFGGKAARDLGNRTRGMAAVTKRAIMERTGRSESRGAGTERRPEGAETRIDVLQDNWSPATRLLMAGAGGALMVFGLMRRGVAGPIVAGAGAAALTRSAANRSLRRLTGLEPDRDAVEFQKTIQVEAPVEDVYRLWSHPEMFPRFMDHLKEVEPMGDGLYRWVAAGPGSVPVTWQARVTEQEPNERVAWESVDGSRVRTHGQVHFENGEDGMTRVHVQMGYTPPGGALGHAIASLLGSDPKHAMDDDFLRLKSLLEKGKATAHGRRVTRMELEAAH